MLTEKDAVIFSNVQSFIIDDIESEDILSSLKENHGINEGHFIDICNFKIHHSRKETNSYLMNILLNTLPNIDVLVGALEEGKYLWLVNFIRKQKFDLFHSIANKSTPEKLGNGHACKGEYAPGDHNGNIFCVEKEIAGASGTSSNYFSLLARGKIPKRSDVYVHRGELFDRLKNLVVTRLNDTDESEWIVLHGMPGCGKSILASEIARDTSLLGQMFPQIFWIPFDRPMFNTDMTRSHDEQEILMQKFHSIFSHLKLMGRHLMSKSDALQDVEDASNRLPELLLKYCPKMLLILDDIWSEYHVQKFDALPCKYLATTQNESLFDSISAKQLMPMNPSGFTRQEAVQAFSKWLDCPPEKLPPLAMGLYEETDGHPFYISLIASFLKSHRNRWTHYYDEIRKNALDEIKSNRNIGAYKARSFPEAVQCSLEDLDEDIKIKYLQLAIFPLRQSIPAKVLGVYWILTQTKVEDLMDQLTTRHLVMKEFDARLNCDVYTVHNLLHRFLKMIVDDKSQKEYHVMLVKNYERSVKSNWANLPKDEYIHRFIGYHVQQAQLFHLFPSIFLNLKFILDKWKMCGNSIAILEDLTVHYKDYLIKENSYEEFCDFLRRNVDSTENLLNAALYEPPGAILTQAEKFN